MAKRSADQIVVAIRKRVGKSGSLTYEELDTFFGDDIDIELVDDIYCELSELGVEVVDKKTKEATRKREAKKRAKAQPRLRFDDPVRMYLREMGQVKLLDRAGEVEICKRIEAAETMVYEAIFESLTTTRRLSVLAERLTGEKIRLDRAVRVDRKRKSATSKEERRRVVLRIEKIVRLDEERRVLVTRLKRAKPQHATQTVKAIERRQKALRTEQQKLCLQPRQVVRMEDRVGELIEKLDRHEEEISELQREIASLNRQVEREESRRK